MARCRCRSALRLDPAVYSIFHFIRVNFLRLDLFTRRGENSTRVSETFNAGVNTRYKSRALRGQ